MKREPVTRLRRTQSGTDSYGDPIYTETSTAIAPALFAPGGPQEPLEPGREPVVMAPTLYWPNEWPDVIASDRLTVRGVTFEIVGQPQDWRGTRVGGLTVSLHAVEEGVA